MSHFDICLLINVFSNLHKYIRFIGGFHEGWSLCVCDEQISEIFYKEENYQEFQGEKEKDYPEDDKITKSIPLFKLLGVH